MGIYTSTLPLAGGGLGWGLNADDTAVLLGAASLYPHPILPPARGKELISLYFQTCVGTYAL
ncbi:MAG: hypothetical protein PHE55_11130 [Methylococcaceae bacterium]|nr:hypothetical protein [Methylococcaceae bacterium]